MAKTLSNKTNFRVVVEPLGLGYFGSVSASVGLIYGRGPEAEKRIERDMEERCNEIVADIKRHADNVGSVYVEFDQQHVCEHCGWKWTEESDTYNGGCCDKDEENAPAETGASHVHDQ